MNFVKVLFKNSRKLEILQTLLKRHYKNVTPPIVAKAMSNLRMTSYA